MENNGPQETGPNQESEKLKKEVGNELKAPKKALIYEDTVQDLNAKILKVTMTIKEEFSELSKFLEEMPVTIPDEAHPDLELKRLILYYHSLNSLLGMYRLEHPHRNV